MIYIIIKFRQLKGSQLKGSNPTLTAYLPFRFQKGVRALNSTISCPAIAIRTACCDRPPVLVDPELLRFLNVGVLCKVQLVTEELELDAYEMPVPKDWKIIELLVKDDNRQAIELLVASTPEYQGYKVTDKGRVIDDENWF